MKKEFRKQELLKIAYELFITKGYEKTSVDEIIEKAKIAKGTYYYYFESKEQTLEEVVNMMIDNGVRKAKEVLNSKLPLENKFIGIILSLRPNVDEINVQNAIHFPENVTMHKKVNEKIIDEATPLLIQLVEEGKKTGLFNCDNVKERKDSKRYALIYIETAEKMLGAKAGTLDFVKELIR